MGKDARTAQPSVTRADLLAKLASFKEQQAQALANYNVLAGMIALCETLLANNSEQK